MEDKRTFGQKMDEFLMKDSKMCIRDRVRR